MLEKTIVMALFASNFAVAQENSCSSFTGQTISTTSFAEAVSYFSELPIKDEFETTLDFNARSSVFFSQLPDELIIPKKPDDLDSITYNFDTNILSIKRWAFKNITMKVGSAADAAGFHGLAGNFIVGNIYAVVSQVGETVMAEATNEFLEQIEVLQTNLTTNAIFERAVNDSPSEEEGLFPNADDSPYVVGMLSVSLEEARMLKPTLELAFVVSPKEPYLFQGSHIPYPPTDRISSRTTEEFSVLVANIRCGLVMDANNLVLGAYPTR